MEPDHQPDSETSHDDEPGRREFLKGLLIGASALALFAPFSQLASKETGQRLRGGAEFVEQGRFNYVYLPTSLRPQLVRREGTQRPIPNEGSKFLRRYLVQFLDDSFAIVELDRDSSNDSKSMTPANSAQTLLDSAVSQSGAKVRHALYLDMGAASKGSFWDSKGNRHDLNYQADLNETNPASYVVFR